MDQLPLFAPVDLTFLAAPADLVELFINFDPLLISFEVLVNLLFPFLLLTGSDILITILWLQI